jgi:hypothetical protein
VTLSGYGDVGFFVPGGDGVGYVQDVGPMATRAFPQYFGLYDWVFLGDILAPAINSRGEPADLGNPPGVNRQDLIDSNGAPSFIANELNLTLSSTLAENVVGVGSVNFLPRTGTDFRFGDAFDVDLLSLEWKVGVLRKTSIYVGKFESVIGIEYPERKANRRFGITPSLIARYTTGTPVGLKFRSRFGDSDWLVIAGALTNGSSVIEPFHFYDETDSNAGKTASGRLAIALPLPVRIELGASGMYGAQDRALDSAHPMWFAGADLQVTWRWWRLGAEYLRGSSDGRGRSSRRSRTPRLRSAPAQRRLRAADRPLVALCGRAGARRDARRVGLPGRPDAGRRRRTPVRDEVLATDRRAAVPDQPVHRRQGGVPAQRRIRRRARDRQRRVHDVAGDELG